MQSKAPGPTKAEKARMSRILELGCVACRMDGHESIYPVEVHHLLDGGVRIGHAASVPVCKWHHRGVPPDGLNQRGATELCGPSLALDGRAFAEHYGDDDSLLAFTERLLKENPAG